MILGCEPWTKPEKGDKFFDLIMNGKLNELLKTWNLYEMVDDGDLLELLNGFFRYEDDRITLEEIKKYQWYKV